jgi:hypothetical protein
MTAVTMANSAMSTAVMLLYRVHAHILFDAQAVVISRQHRSKTGKGL